MVPLSFADHRFVAMPEGALYWPAKACLLVADLHLEKSSFFARLGQMLPPYDSLATLSAIELAVERTGARRLWCLGDSFHDRLGCERLPPAARAQLVRLTGRLEWLWITGNHDPVLVDRCGGEVAAEVEAEGLRFRHEADPGSDRPELSGHFHPKLMVTVRGRRIARRCFVMTATKLVLPAFGVLTGGLDAADPAVRRVVGRPACALVPTSGRLLRFPLAG